MTVVNTDFFDIVALYRMDFQARSNRSKEEESQKVLEEVGLEDDDG